MDLKLYKCRLDSENRLLKTGESCVFESLQELGRGSSCVGYSARLNGRPYVLKKRLASAMLGPDDFLEAYRFQTHELNSILPHVFSWTEGLFTDDENNFYYAAKGNHGISFRALIDDKAVSLSEKLEYLLILCNIISKLAENDLFFYDLKPENCLVIHEGGRNLEIFDTDSISPMSGTVPSRMYISPCWIDRSFRVTSPSECMSVYTLGAIFYEILFINRTSFDDYSNAVYPFGHSPYKNELDFELREKITRLLRSSYCILQNNRLKTAADFASKLTEIINLLNDKHRRLLNASVPRLSMACIGREQDEELLFSMISGTGHNLFFLNGMGGIGKSYVICDLARRFGDRLGFFYTFYSNSLYDTILNLNFGTPRPDEKHEEHYSWIMNRLSEYSEKNLLIIDNCDISNGADPFTSSGKHDVLRELSRLKLKILFVSRFDVSGYISSEQIYNLPPLTDNSCRKLVTDIAGSPISDGLFLHLMRLTGGHTLLLSIIASTIRESFGRIKYEDIIRALSSDPGIIKKRVRSDYLPDARTLSEYLQAVLNISSFSDSACNVLSIASILPLKGLSLELFYEVFGDGDDEFAETADKLIKTGWLHLSSDDQGKKIIFMHPSVSLMCKENPRTALIWEHIEIFGKRLEKFKIKRENKLVHIDGTCAFQHYSDGSNAAAYFSRHILENVSVPFIDCVLLDDVQKKIYSRSVFETGESPNNYKLMRDKALEHLPEHNPQTAELLTRAEEPVLRIPDSCEIIPILNYENTSATHIIIPASVTEIGPGAFFSGRIEQVDIYGCPNIGDFAFAHCSALQAVNFHADCGGGRYIGNNAFVGCRSLKHISLPPWITDIQSGAFMHTGLEEISLSYVKSMGESVFRNCRFLSRAQLPTALEIIPSSTFADCSALKRVTLGKVKELGSDCFSCCTSLESVSETVSFHGLYLEALEKMGLSVFSRCTSIRSVYAPKLKEIEASCFFGCESLISVYSPDLKNLGLIGSFRSCKKLEKITLSADCTTIPWGCFKGCASLTCISCNCDDNCETIDLSHIEHIGKYSFQNSNIRRVKLSELKSIGESAFQDCVDLEFIEFPVNFSSSDSIADSAFWGCTAISTVRNCPDPFLFRSSPDVFNSELNKFIQDDSDLDDPVKWEKRHLLIENRAKTTPYLTAERFYNLYYYYLGCILQKRLNYTEVSRIINNKLLELGNPELFERAVEGLVSAAEDTGHWFTSRILREKFNKLKNKLWNSEA